MTEYSPKYGRILHLRRSLSKGRWSRCVAVMRRIYFPVCPTLARHISETGLAFPYGSIVTWRDYCVSSGVTVR